MRILITGVAGLIGSNFADWLLENTEDTVIGIDNLSGGYLSNVDERVTFYKGDIDNKSMEEIFHKHRPDVVYHFAAYAAEGLSPFIRCFNYQNNVVSTAAVTNACIKYRTRLVFASSIAVYGDQEPPFHEKMLPRPVDPYGIAKYTSEMDIAVAGRQHGLDYTIVRPYNVYGPKQNIWDKYRNVFGIWFRQYQKGEPLRIFGSGEQKRSFTYVGDIMAPLSMAAVSCEHPIINLGSSKLYTINEARKAFVKTVTKGSNFSGWAHEHVETRHEVDQAFSNNRLAQHRLGYDDKTSLEKGLREMWKWVQKQPDRKIKDWDSFEIDEGMYPSWQKPKIVKDELSRNI